MGLCGAYDHHIHTTHSSYMGFRPYFHADAFHHQQRLMHHWYHRGPSRLLWFLFGAGAATWWMKHKEYQGYQVKHCMRSRIPPEAYPPPAQQQDAHMGQSEVTTSVRLWDELAREWGEKVRRGDVVLLESE